MRLLANRHGREDLSKTSSLFCMAESLSESHADDNSTVLAAAFFVDIVPHGGSNVLYPMAARIDLHAVRATGNGWAMCVGRIGAFAGPLLGGRALALHWP
jgi:hypothetical protein